MKQENGISEIQRETKTNKLKFSTQGKIKTVNKKDFLKKTNANGIIRIPKKDILYFNEKEKTLTHFNLQSSGHKVKKIYLLPKILKNGYYKNDEDEKLPLLDFKFCLIGKCIKVKNNISYEDLTKGDFKHSFEHIKNIKSLKKKIIERYSKSMPNLSEKEILSLGIGITTLEITGRKDKITSKMKNKTKGSIREGFSQGLLETAKTNKNITALTADLKDSLKLTEFAKKYPKQFYEFGIAEQNMMSAAAGMTINNKIPFVCSYAAFNPGRNWDQLRVSVCYQNSNVKIIGGHAGLTTGPDGATHQALEDIAITRVLPNLTVIVPCDQEEAKKATIEAAKYKGPVYIRLTREKSENITTPKSKFQIGKANILKTGDDITIIACGITVQFALEAHNKLKEQNINATIINLHTIKPLNEKTILKYAKKTNKIITIEEHQKIGGMGSAIAEFLSQNHPTPIEIIGVENTFGESGGGYELLEKYNISTKEIIKRAKKLIRKQ